MLNSEGKCERESIGLQSTGWSKLMHDSDDEMEEEEQREELLESKKLSPPVSMILNTLSQALET